MKLSRSIFAGLSGIALIFLSSSLPIVAQVPAAQKIFPNLIDNIDRPLRYHPEGEDFVIENGPEFFNRPLYGGKNPFPSARGDETEFVVYLPRLCGKQL